MSPMPERIHKLNDHFYIRAKWKLCRVVWPRTCEISGRRLWTGTWAYRGLATWTGPGTPIIEYKWHDRQEHLMWQLKE